MEAYNNMLQSCEPGRKSIKCVRAFLPFINQVRLSMCPPIFANFSPTVSTPDYTKPTLREKRVLKQYPWGAIATNGTLGCPKKRNLFWILFVN